MPKVLGANLSDEVEALILDCVKKNPDLRPTAQQVHERLQEEVRPARNARAVPPISEPPPPAERTPTHPQEELPREPPTRETPLQEPPPGDPSGAGRHEGNRRPRGPILLAAAALLLVLLGVTAYALGLVGNGETGAAKAPQEEKEQASSAESESNQPVGGGEETTSGQTAAEGTAGARQEETAAGGSGGESGSEAAQAVEDHYTAAADGDYDEAWNSLSSAGQQRYGPQANYTGQFGTLESIEFTQGPTTTAINGDTATVTGRTTAEHTDRTEQNSGTWTLVNEGGEWKISNIAVQRIS